MPQVFGQKQSFTYYAFGLHFDSMLELVGLPAAPASKSPDVRIRVGAIPEHLPKISEKSASFEIAPTDCLLIAPGIGRYRVTDGSKIVIDPAPAASAEDLRAVIYSAALGVLFHQRELVPIHASAISTGAGCLAFAGTSHAGKSTLVCYLQERGYQVVADDVCLLSCRPGQPVLAFPGAPSIRLWKDALDLFGKDTRDYARVSESADKFHTPPHRRVTAGALPLLGIVQIGVPETDERRPFTRLHGLDAAMVIIEETFWDSFVSRMGHSARFFHAAVDIANQVPVYRCNLSKTWERMRAFESFIQNKFETTC